MSLSEARSPTKHCHGSDTFPASKGFPKTSQREIQWKIICQPPIWIVPEAGKVLVILERIKKRHGHVWIGQTPICPMPTLTLRQSLPMAFQIAIQRGRQRMPRIRGVRRRPHFEDYLNPRGGAVAEPSDKSEFDSATLFLNPL